jgi:hypothetical protein
MSAATGDGASELTVKGLVQQVLDGQKSLHADLQVLRPSLEGEKEEDQWLLVLKEPSGESDQLNASIAEVRQRVRVPPLLCPPCLQQLHLHSAPTTPCSTAR